MKGAGRLILSILIIALVSSIIPGCETSSSKKDSGGLRDILPESSPSGPVTLTFYFPGNKAREGTGKLLDEIEKRVKESLNIKLDIQLFDGYADTTCYVNKMKTILASQGPCEAFAYVDGYSQAKVRMNMKELDKNGFLMDITEVFPRSAPGLYARYTGEELASAVLNGRLKAVPSLFPRSFGCCAVVRKDIMEKYKLPEIKSMDDYELYLKTVTEKEAGLTPLVTTPGQLVKILAQAYDYAILDERLGLVYRWNDSGMKVFACEQTPEYAKIFEMFGRWESKGYLEDRGKVVFDADTYSPVKGFVGSAASYIGTAGMEAVIDYYGACPVYWHKYGYETKYYPLYPEKIAQKASPSTFAIAIPSYAKHPDKTLKFIEWVQSSQENYDLFMYGIKGRHYTLYGEQYNIRVGQGEPYPFSLNDYINYWQGSETLRNLEYYRTGMSSPPDEKKNYTEITGLNAKYPPHLGFYPDLSTVKQEVMLRWNSNTRMPSFNIGQYVQEQKENGVDAIVLEVQRQLDAWRTENKK